MTPQTSSKGGHHSLHQESVFATVKEPLPPNNMKNYDEDIILKQSAMTWGDFRPDLSRAIFTKLKKEYHLPMTDDLSSIIHNRIESLIPEFINLVLSSEFVEELHSKESHAIKSRTLGAVLREEPIPFVKGGYNKAIIIDNQPRNLSDQSFLANSIVDTGSCCVNPYCHQVGQFTFKGKDKKTDFYCPKCKTTYHWISVINNIEAE